MPFVTVNPKVKLIVRGVPGPPGDISVPISSLTFDTVNPDSPTTIAQLTWDQEDDTLEFRQNGTTLQIGQEQQWPVVNKTGSDIVNGTPVMAVGTTGATGRLNIAPMDGTNTENTPFFGGLATEDIDDQSNGKVSTFGKVRDIQTDGGQYGETWVDEDLIYVSPTTIGALTNIEPTEGQVKIICCFVINAHPTDGVLAVRVTPIDENLLLSQDQKAAVDGSNSPSESNVFATAADIRELLTANRTYYVRKDGSDSNTGLIDDAAGAFLTIQKAIDVVLSIDFSIYDVVMQVDDGTYSENLSIESAFVGSGSVTLQGDTVTPGDVIISGNSGSVLSGSNGAVAHIQGFKITTTGSNGIFSTSNSLITFSELEFGTVGSSGAHIRAANGGLATASGDYSITGNAANHIRCGDGSILRTQSRTITLSGTPNFSQSFAKSDSVGVLYATGATYIGSATGKRYDVFLNAIINTAGGGANFFPGNVAGTFATGGQYV